MPNAAADSVSDQQAEVKQVVAEIDRLHEKVDQLNEDYVGYLNEKQQLDGEIVIAQQKIAEQQAQLGTLQAQLASVAVEKVMGGGPGALGPLFTDPAAIDEGLQRDHLNRVAVNAGAASTDDYETLLDDLASEQRSLEKKQQKALDLAKRPRTPAICYFAKGIVTPGKNLTYETFFTPFLACSGCYTFDGLNV